MAKRKSTDKPSLTETEKSADAADVAEAKTPSEDLSNDADAVAEAVDAVDTYAPADPAEGSDTAAATPEDDVVELVEPGKDVEKTDTVTTGDDAGPVADPDVSQSSDNHISEEEAERLIEDVETSQPKSGSGFTPVSPVAPEVVRETVVERKGGFVPMLLGGAVCAILGYGVAAYVSQDVWPFAQPAQEDPLVAEVRGALATQDETLAGVIDRLTALEGVEPPTVDLSPVESQIAEVQETAAGLSTRLDEIVSRIDTLEKQPLEQAVSPEAIAAYERALAELQAEVEAQRAEVQQMAQEAMQAEGNATEQARLAAARTAMAEVTAALETGAGFADALGVLSLNGLDVPNSLSAVSETGVATQVALIESFPEAARAALSAVRSTETETAQGSNRISTFFANQLGARSVAPREGNDPDAILSRSEAALRSGDLSTAIAELSALPEVAQDAMSGWQARAETRLEAKTAADALVQQLLQN